MTTALIIALLLVTLHFIYDGIILPTIHLHLRNELFALRDEIRSIMIRDEAKRRDKAFVVVHDVLSNCVSRLPECNLRLAYEVHQLEKEAETREEIEAFNKLIESSKDIELTNIYLRTQVSIGKAFIANSGGWMFYLVPIVILAVSLNKLPQLAKGLIAMPNTRLNRLHHTHHEPC